MFLPNVIQGGMGVYISSPFLARQVSLNGGLGTVSGTAAYIILSRILQRGDPGGHYRRALAHFPFQEVAEKVLEEHFVPGGIPEDKQFKSLEGFTLSPSKKLIDLTVCANFAFVWLSKEGHDKPISINYLEHVKMPHIYSLVGAMLGGVDVVTMGAGIPLQVPKLLDAIASNQTASYRVEVLGIEGRSNEVVTMSFDAEEHFGSKLPPLRRPDFLPIVSTHVLAQVLLKRSGSPISGFVVETPVAGGHNAPPRDKSETYGPKDTADWAVMRDLGLPFWIGGGFASPEALRQAKELGAIGIQCGSIFALSEESGMNPILRAEICRQGFRGDVNVVTDFQASPTGFPFKVVSLSDTVSEESVYTERTRNCSQKCLVTPVRLGDGKIDYRCPAEPIHHFVLKGGKVEQTEGSKCICNGLVALASTPSVPDSPVISLGCDEPPIVTMGDHVEFLRDLMKDEDDSYTASAALNYLINNGRA